MRGKTLKKILITLCFLGLTAGVSAARPFAENPDATQALSQLIARPLPEPVTMMLFGVFLTAFSCLVRSRKDQ